MSPSELLDHELKTCQIHADRLNLALNKIKHLYPFTGNSISTLTDEDLGYFELFTSRLDKLQDSLGEKVFTTLLDLIGETTENKSYLDKLNKLEKLEILPSVDWWQNLRKLRNILVHEYPDDPAFIADNLNQAFIQAQRLLTFWESLLNYIRGQDLSS